MHNSTTSLFGFVFVLVASTAAPVLADDSITLHAHKSAQGEKWTEEKSEASNLTVDYQGKKIPVIGAKTLKKTIEVTKVANAIAIEQKVTYGAITETERVGGKDKAKPASPIANKGYKLVAGSPFTVEALTGKAGPDEIEAVRKREKQFGKADKMDKVLDGKTFRKGMAVKLPSSELASVLGDDEIFQQAEMSLTYKGTTGNLATFDMTTKMEGDKDGAHMVMDASGTVTVDVKVNSVVGMKMKGTIKASGGKAPVTGTIELSERTTR